MSEEIEKNSLTRYTLMNWLYDYDVQYKKACTAEELRLFVGMDRLIKPPIATMLSQFASNRERRRMVKKEHNNGEGTSYKILKQGVTYARDHADEKQDVNAINEYYRSIGKSRDYPPEGSEADQPKPRKKYTISGKYAKGNKKNTRSPLGNSPQAEQHAQVLQQLLSADAMTNELARQNIENIKPNINQLLNAQYVPILSYDSDLELSIDFRRLDEIDVNKLNFNQQLEWSDEDGESTEED